MSAMALSSGFSDPVIEAQAHFHAVMNALARPGSIQPLASALQAPHPLSPGLAALALTLADHEAPLWLDAGLAASREVVDYLRFHTGARISADPAEAAFALIADWNTLPDLARFSLGSDEFPDRSTTLIIAVPTLASGHGLELIGPGIEGRTLLSVEGWPSGLAAQLAANHARFPRGVDLIFVAPGQIAALPRTTIVSEG
jgi:alpha-D-ribose 1-methylphosphonate 5-triphosphate synthase subunit PhnH